MNDVSNIFWITCAGVSGAFIGMSRKKCQWTVLQRFSYLFSGSLVAFWLSPFICKQFSLPEPEEVSVIAFLCGLFWTELISRLKKTISQIIDNLKAIKK
jgi:hypothetical protein